MVPDDKTQARKLRYQSARYTVINDVLYKCDYTTPYLNCVTAEQGAKCQQFRNVPHIPAEPLTPIVSPWPYTQWGLDLIGPMP